MALLPVSEASAQAVRIVAPAGSNAVPIISPVQLSPLNAGLTVSLPSLPVTSVLSSLSANVNLVPSAIIRPAAKANVNTVSAKAVVPSAKRAFVPKAFAPTAKAVVESPSAESAVSESRVLFDTSVRRSSLDESVPVAGTLSSPSAVFSAADEDISPLKTPSVPPAPQSGFAAKWNRWTQRLTDFAAVPFLALQIPQIISNITNLVGGHADQLANLPWMGYSTGILGNMLLLSWFSGQKETSAARVQAIGVATSAIVVAQIFLAGFMPGAAFVGVLGAVAAGLTLNWLKFKDKAPAGAWSFWTKASSLLGLVVLPQVLWTTFAPAAAFSYLPGLIAGAAGLTMMALESRGKLPARLQGVWSSLAAWTATLLFMYGPIAQLMANHANPAGMAGLSVGTMLLAMAGNLLMLPRAMLTKNLIWFTGSAWGVAVGGWAVMLGMYLGGFVGAPLFFAVSAFVPVYLLVAHFLNRVDRPLPSASSSGANRRAPGRFNWRMFGFSVGGAAVVGLGIAAVFAAFSPLVWPVLLVFFGAGTPLYAAIFHALKARFGRGEPSVVPSITAAVGVQMAVFSILAAAGISALGLAGVLAVTAALIAQAALVRPRDGFAGTADFLGSLIMLGVSLVGLAGMVFVIGGMSVLGGVLLGVAGLAAGYAALAHLRENKR